MIDPTLIIRKINLIFSVSPVVSLFLMIFLARIFSGTGQTPSFLISIIFTAWKFRYLNAMAESA